MASESFEAISRLSDSANRLNEVTDEASDIVARLEDYLGSLNLGFQLFVRINDEDPNKLLGYERLGKPRAYRITVGGSTGKGTPWAELARDDKIEALIALPKLIQRISAAVEEKASRAQAALEEVSQFLPKGFLAAGGIGDDQC